MILNQIEKKQKIKWDEETIAEHDKERGTRQKIDEAPTPYRYLSESESDTDPDFHKLGHKKLVKDSTQRNVAFCDNHPNNTHNSISDSWEIINAKLQYEKHLQDINDCSHNNNNLLSSSPTLYTSESTTSSEILNDRSNQRKEFYLDNNDCDTIRESEDYDSSNASITVVTSNNDNSANDPSWKQYRGKSANSQHPHHHRVNIKIEDLQTNFGEILNHSNPAPAAFSPQFTRKQYRPNYFDSTNNNNIDNNDNNQAYCGNQNATENNSIPKPPAPRIIVKPRAVFIPVGLQNNNIIQDNTNKNICNIKENTSFDPTTNTTITNNNIILQPDQDNDSSPILIHDKDKFINKRAGHYNEYKVLQAMRAKLATEDEDDDNDDA